MCLSTNRRKENQMIKIKAKKLLHDLHSCTLLVVVVFLSFVKFIITPSDISVHCINTQYKGITRLLNRSFELAFVQHQHL